MIGQDAILEIVDSFTKAQDRTILMLGIRLVYMTPSRQSNSTTYRLI
jgi:hypothetical protein